MSTEWEKIVLNVPSHAFKFTFEGAITVEVRQSPDGTPGTDLRTCG
jgi:hypothetical protein